MLTFGKYGLLADPFVWLNVRALDTPYGKDEQQIDNRGGKGSPYTVRNILDPEKDPDPVWTGIP